MISKKNRITIDSIKKSMTAYAEGILFENLTIRKIKNGLQKNLKPFVDSKEVKDITVEIDHQIDGRVDGSVCIHLPQKSRTKFVVLGFNIQPA